MVTIILALITAGGLVWTYNQPATSKPVVTPSASPSPIDIKEHAKDLVETKQFIEGSQVDTVRDTDSLGATNPVYSSLAIWTANEYIKNNITNLYFVSGYWEKKDKFSDSAMNTYTFKYLSDSVKQDYLNALQDTSSAAFRDFYNTKVFLPTPGLNVMPPCYDQWLEEACYTIAPPPGITAVKVTGLTDTSVQLDLTVDINPIYENPNAPGGSTMIQPRTYHLTMVLSETNSYSPDNPDLPIMLIESINGTLEIKDTVDYITNSDN